MLFKLVRGLKFLEKYLKNIYKVVREKILFIEFGGIYEK